MKILLQKNNIILLTVVFPFLIAMMLNCEGFEMDSLKLTNNTSQTMSYLVMTVEQSHLVDLNSKSSLSNDTRIVSTGESDTLSEEDIWGYQPGDNIQFYFYEVIGDTAYFSGELRLTHKKLRELNFQVVIDDEELTTSKVK